MNLISDLALILISAGLVTLIFKRLRQPLVLGYIVAGFLAGPHMPYTPSVENTGGVQTWADIGVIFLMFTLGLEFSFKKIVKMGVGPVIAACCVMFCMISVGSGVGHLFGWSSMDSLFLGGMLAMSSTTIIYKAFEDLGLRSRKFAGEVLSVLILEDILGILLMVILSALAVSRQFEGVALMGSLLKLAFFLILWFIVGVYLVPLFLRKSARWMNRETLLVVATGLCFALVVAAERAGYSAAFGAFMMGSILAETVEAENVARIITPVKDLFGAIFFVSVGMLVDPAVLVEYAVPILVITLAILAGQVVLGTSSFLVSGQSLKVSMQCGFSLTQIGEFAFILASLGVTLGVTSPFLYPVVVAVSVITTFLTPYMIRAALPAYAVMERTLPAGVRRRLEGRGAHHTQPQSPWRTLLRTLVSQTAAYATLTAAGIVMAGSVLLPLCRSLMGRTAGSLACGMLTLVIVSPFLRAIVMRKNHSIEWKKLARRGRIHRIGLQATVVARFAIAAGGVAYLIHRLSPLSGPEATVIHLCAAAAAVAAAIASRTVKWVSIRMERTFVQNLRRREELERNGQRPRYAGRLLSHNVHIARLELPDATRWAGKTLRELAFGERDHVMIAAVIRGKHRINIPDGMIRLYPGDCVEAIGDDAGIERFAQRMETEVVRTNEDGPGKSLTLRRIIIGETSPLTDKRLSESMLRTQYRCMAVGFEDKSGDIVIATSDRIIRNGDTLWLVGEEQDLKRLAAEG